MQEIWRINMKNKLIFAIMTLCLFVGGIQAQDNSEVTLGVQYTRSNPNIVKPNFKLNDTTDTLGIVASITSYETKALGLTAEGSGNFNVGENTSQIFTVMGGLTLKARRDKSVQPFIKGLAGIAIERADNERLFSTDSRTSLGSSLKASVGVDYGQGRVKFRLAELGVLQTNVFSTKTNYFVASTGIVF